MKTIIELTSCHNCGDYNQVLGLCFHPSINNQGGMEVGGVIPDNCPRSADKFNYEMLRILKQKAVDNIDILGDNARYLTPEDIVPGTIIRFINKICHDSGIDDVITRRDFGYPEDDEDYEEEDGLLKDGEKLINV